MVGNIVSPQAYHPDVVDQVFLSEGAILGDYVYQDILNTCTYNAELNAFSYKNVTCQVGTSIQPFWIGRLTPNQTGQSSVSLLKSYFSRNHSYRTAGYKIPARILSYQPILPEIDPDGTLATGNIKRIAHYGDFASSTTKIINEKLSNSDSLYLTAITKTSNMVLLFNGHGLPKFHQKQITHTSITKTNFFLGQLLSCSVGRFTTPDYMAGKYLFGGGLIVEAASTPIFASGQIDPNFYHLISSGVPYFQAIKWAGVGSNILGDPSLKFKATKMVATKRPKANLSESSLSFSKIEPTKSLILRNDGNSDLLFDTRFVYHKQVGLEKLNGSSVGFDPNIKGGPNEIGFKLEAGKQAIVDFQTEYFIPYNDLAKGTYKATWMLVTNDPERPFIEFPLTFSVN